MLFLVSAKFMQIKLFFYEKIFKSTRKKLFGRGLMTLDHLSTSRDQFVEIKRSLERVTTIRQQQKIPSLTCGTWASGKGGYGDT